MPKSTAEHSNNNMDEQLPEENFNEHQNAGYDSSDDSSEEYGEYIDNVLDQQEKDMLSSDDSTSETVKDEDLIDSTSDLIDEATNDALTDDGEDKKANQNNNEEFIDSLGKSVKEGYLTKEEAEDLHTLTMNMHKDERELFQQKILDGEVPNPDLYQATLGELMASGSINLLVHVSTYSSKLIKAQRDRAAPNGGNRIHPFKMKNKPDLTQFKTDVSKTAEIQLSAAVDQSRIELEKISQSEFGRQAQMASDTREKYLNESDPDKKQIYLEEVNKYNEHANDALEMDPETQESLERLQRLDKQIERSSGDLVSAIRFDPNSTMANTSKILKKLEKFNDDTSSTVSTINFAKNNVKPGEEGKNDTKDISETIKKIMESLKGLLGKKNASPSA